jgi:hypothetical protein
VLVKHHLKALKLPTMHSECEKVAARAAKENLDASHDRYLITLPICGLLSSLHLPSFPSSE